MEKPTVNAEFEYRHRQLREQYPELESLLLDGEYLVNVESKAYPKQDKSPSGIAALYKLTDATNRREVGENGPARASYSMEDGPDNPELHLYETLFGRDSLRVALNLIDRYPKLTRTTLVKLAELQGIDYNAPREEEPGKIIHEYRDPNTDEIARHISKEKGWQWPYYGSVDSTPEYVRLMCSYINKHDDGILNEYYVGKDGVERSMAESLQSAVEWISDRLMRNPEGLLEYKPSFEGSLENQVWKDSWDAYFYADGTIADQENSIASIEVQRVAYDALRSAAGIYKDYFGREMESGALLEQADNLKHQIMDLFWQDERGGYFALGTSRTPSGVLELLSIKTSNMGHLLHSDLLKGHSEEAKHKRESVARQLFSEHMLASGGIRTLSEQETRYRPGSYHNGSVWLWDTYIIAEGLRDNGYAKLAKELEKRIRKTIKSTNMFPEFVRGDGAEPETNSRIIDVWDSSYQRFNRIEQPPQEIQAWSVAAVLAMKARNWKDKLRPSTTNKDKEFESEIIDSLDSI